MEHRGPHLAIFPTFMSFMSFMVKLQAFLPQAGLWTH